MLQRKKLTNEYLPYLVLMGIFVFYHLNMTPGVDDLRFGQQDLAGIFRFSVERYQTWTSRQIVEFVQVTLQNLPLIIWHILDLLILLLVAVTSVKLLSDGKCEEDIMAARWMVVLSILIFEAPELSTAGWITTSMVYLWVLSLGLFTLWFVWNHMHGTNLPKWMYPLALCALLFSTNVEQPASLVLGFSLCFLIYALYTGKKKTWVIIALAVSIAAQIYSLTCPGNAARLTSSINFWLPDFADFSMIHKLRLGVGITMDDLFHDFHPNSLLFLTVLSAIGWKKSRCWQEKLIAVFPAALSWWFIVGNSADLGLDYLRLAFPLIRHDADALMYIAIYGVATLCVLYNICLAFGKQPKTLMMLVIFAAGCCSRAMMGFSPTIYGSGRRTGLFLTYAISFITVAAMLELRQYNRKKGLPPMQINDGVKVLVVLLVFAMVMMNALVVY